MVVIPVKLYTERRQNRINRPKLVSHSVIWWRSYNAYVTLYHVFQLNWPRANSWHYFKKYYCTRTRTIHDSAFKNEEVFIYFIKCSKFFWGDQIHCGTFVLYVSVDNMVVTPKTFHSFKVLNIISFHFTFVLNVCSAGKANPSIHTYSKFCQLYVQKHYCTTIKCGQSSMYFQNVWICCTVIARKQKERNWKKKKIRGDCCNEWSCNIFSKEDKILQLLNLVWTSFVKNSLRYWTLKLRERRVCGNPHSRRYTLF